MKTILAFIFGIALSLAAIAVAQDYSFGKLTGVTFIDLKETGVPVVPLTGTQRWYANINTHLLTCLRSDTTPCGSPLTGVVTMSTSTCPTGFTEVTDVNGKVPIGTLAANGNVGTFSGAINGAGRGVGYINLIFCTIN